MFKKLVFLAAVLLPAPAYAATTTYKICGLPDAVSIQSTDHFELSRNCAGSYNATAPELATYFSTYFTSHAPGSTGQILYNSAGLILGGSASTIKTLLSLSTVASTGAYSDLSGKPTALSQFTNDTNFISTGGAPVQSVNSQTGTVSLTTTNINEGTNLYYTNGRADARITAALGSINGLVKANGAGVLSQAVAGDVPTLNQNTTGNAGTATALQTARAINGVNFDGTAPITVAAAASTLTGSTLASGVTSSSITSFGPSPSLTTPNIGVATATSVNKIAITAPATGSTLTIADGKTLTANNTLTLSGTDGTTYDLQNSRKRSIGFSALSPVTGQQGSYYISPCAGTITGWSIVADAGTATVKTWKHATGTTAPTSSDSISTSGVSLSSGTAIHSATVSDFTSTSVAANDVFAFNLSAVATATKLDFQLEITCN